MPRMLAPKASLLWSRSSPAETREERAEGRGKARMDMKREERGNRWRQREGIQEKEKRGGLEEHTHGQGEWEKKTD